MVSLLLATATGRISGTVTDAKTGDPLFGVSFRLEETGHGAKSDVNGDFLIGGLPAGTYTLVVSSVGYESLKVEGLVVSPDTTLKLTLRLNQTVIETGKAISVTGDRKSLDFNSTSITSEKPADAVRVAPVATVKDRLTREATKPASGDKKLEVRCGRSGEGTYRIDGVDQSGGAVSYMKQSPQCVYPCPSLAPQQPYPPAHGGTNIVNGQPYDAMFFKN
jgi:hypothetical protein